MYCVLADNGHGDGGADCRTSRVLHTRRQLRLRLRVQSPQTTGSRYLPGMLDLDRDLDPSGCIAPHFDTILICFELPPPLPPR